MRDISTEGLMRSTDENGTVTFTLDRPERNLLVPDLMDGLRQALLDAVSADDVRCIVLANAGDTFCGGLDIPHMKATGADPVSFARSAVELLRVFPGLGTPVVASVRGDALALGYSIVCAADIAVTVAGASLGTFEASIGMWPMVAQVPPLLRLAPRHALQNILTGEPYDAERACEIGIVNEVVGDDELDARIAQWAQRVVVAGPALAAGRRSFYRFLEMTYDDALTEGLDAFARMFR